MNYFSNQVLDLVKAYQKNPIHSEGIYSQTFVTAFLKVCLKICSTSYCSVAFIQFLPDVLLRKIQPVL